MALDKARVLAAAQKQLARNNIDKAIKELSRIVREDPKDLRVRQKVAELLARQGKVPEAMREFQIVAEAYERGGFYPKAAAIYKQMLRFEPDQMQWHLALGEIYQQLALLSDAMDHFNRVATHFDEHGNTRERLDIYNKLLRLNPESIEYGEKLAEIYAQDNDPVGAFEVWRGLAEILEQRGDLESLIRVYERMSSLRPDELTLVRALADLYLDRGDPKRALAKLQICFKNDPQDTETLNLLADAFIDLGQAAKAVAVLKELAQIYESLGYEDYRNQVYDRIAELDPSEGDGLAGDGGIEGVGGDDAVEGLQLAVAQELPDAVGRAMAEVEVYLQYGLSEKAVALLEKTVAGHSQAYGAHRELVRLYVATGEPEAGMEHLTSMYEIAMDLNDYNAARACLSRACEIDGDDAAARARLEAFEQAMGDFMGADPDESQAEVAFDDPPPAGDAGSDVVDLGSAIELSTRIAADRAEQLDEAGIDPDSSLAGGTEDFDFDDDEMQRLAAELADGGAPPSAPAADDDDAGDDDPFSGLDDIDIDDLGLDDKPETRLSAFELAMSYYETGMYEDAALEFRRSADEGEQLAQALEFLGLSLRRNRDFRGAVEALRDALKSGQVKETESVLRIMFELGVTYEAAGNRRGALKIYQKITARRADFRDGEVANRVSSLALELGDA